mgnify:FL=1
MTTTNRTRRYYAVNYGCGLAVSWHGGRYSADYHSFPTQEKRDEWVSEGGDFTSSPNYREAIPSRDRELRAIQRCSASSEWSGSWSVEVEHHDVPEPPEPDARLLA